MEKFKKVTEEFIERVEILKGQVVENISARDIIYGSENNALRGTGKFALLTDTNGAEYLSNSIFAIKKGLIAELDNIFEENLSKTQKGNFKLDLFTPEQYDSENQIVCKLIDTRISSKKATSFIDSHYYRFFNENGVSSFKAGPNNCVLMFDSTGGFVGVSLGIKVPGNFDKEITLEELQADYKLIEDYNKAYTLEFEKFQGDLKLLDEVFTKVNTSLNNTALNHLEISKTTDFEFGKVAQLNLNSLSLMLSLSVFVNNNKFTLKNNLDMPEMIKEDCSSDEILQSLFDMIDIQIKKLEERAATLTTLNNYIGQSDVIIEIDGEKYFASNQFYKSIKKGRLTGENLNYKNSREDFIYTLYEENRLEYFQVFQGESLAKNNLDNLALVFIKDIVDADSQSTSEANNESLDMQLLFKLKNTQESELLNVLAEILVLQANFSSGLSDCLKQECDLIKEINRTLDMLVDKALDDIEEFTDDQMLILQSYANTMPFLNSDTLEKIDVAIQLKTIRLESSNDSTCSKETNEIFTEKEDSDVISSNDTSEINKETDVIVVNNTNTIEEIQTIEDDVLENVNTQVVEMTLGTKSSEEADKNYLDDPNIKLSFDTIIKTVSQLEWSIVKLLYSNRNIKATIKNKYNNSKVVGLLVDEDDKSIQQIANLLSEYYSVPVYAADEAII